MNISYDEIFVLRRREPAVWRCPFWGRKKNSRLFILVMRNTRDIAQSKAKDFADSPQTHFSAQIKWRVDVGLGTRLVLSMMGGVGLPFCFRFIPIIECYRTL